MSEILTEHQRMNIPAKVITFVLRDVGYNHYLQYRDLLNACVSNM